MMKGKGGGGVKGRWLTLNQSRSLCDILLPGIQQPEQTCILVPAWLQGGGGMKGRGADSIRRHL